MKTALKTWPTLLHGATCCTDRTDPSDGPTCLCVPPQGYLGETHTKYHNKFQHLVIQFNFKLFLSPVVNQMLFSVSLLYLHWQLRVKEASLPLCPLWLVSPAVQHPGIKTNRVHMNILKMSEGVLWQCFSFKSSYHLMLGSKNSVAWDCAQTRERQAELIRQKQTVKIIYLKSKVCLPV